MSEYTTAATTKQGSVWEDLLEVLWAPAAVFERSRSRGVGMFMLLLTIVLVVVLVATKNLLQPFVDANYDLQVIKMAEQGQMPVVVNEDIAYGYEAENKHFVRAFLGKEKPLLTWHDGLDVVRILMHAYKSAELGKTLEYKENGVDKFVPQVGRGDWKP